MGGPVWKRINVLGPQAVNGLNVMGNGRSGFKKFWTVLSLAQSFTPWQQATIEIRDSGRLGG